MTSKTRSLVVAGLLIGIGAGWFGARLWRAHTTIAGNMPEYPDLSAWPAEMQERAQTADRDARGWFGNVAALANMSRLYHANGFYAEALACYRGLEQCEPGEARWLHLHANLVASLGQPDEAVPLFRRAVAQASDYAPARVRLGDALLKAGQAAEAVQVYNDVLVRHGDHPYALLGLARCAVANKDFAGAKPLLARALAVEPEFIGALSLLVSVHEHFGEANEANALKEQIGRREFSDLPDPWLDDLIEECYDPYRLSVVAVVADVARDRPKAMRLLERAVALAPGTGSYHRQLGLMLSHVPDFPAARRHLERAVALAPTDADAWLLLFQLLKMMGEKETAGQTIANGLAHCPDSASLRIEQARRLNEAGLREEAINQFQEAYRVHPSEAGPLVEMASVLFTVGRPDEALAALREALLKTPGHPMALATLTFHSISSGDESAALGWWEQVRRQPRTPLKMVNQIKEAFRQRFGRELP